MLKLCICVTGTTGSGKTTLVKALGSRGFRTIHTGEMFRAEVNEIKAGESVITPASYDNRIQSCITDTLKSITGPVGLVALECYPRSPAQVEWLSYVKEELGWEVIVVALDAERETRYNRVVSRNVCDSKRMEHDRNKMVEEHDRFQQELVNALMYATTYNKLTLYTYDTSKWDYTKVDEMAISCNIRGMVNCALNYWRKKTHCTDADELPNPDRMVYRATEELVEYAKDSNTSELIDALWFLLLALVGSGWSVEKIFSQFMYKYNINEERMEKGIKPYEDEIIKGD